MFSLDLKVVKTAENVMLTPIFAVSETSTTLTTSFDAF